MQTLLLKDKEVLRFDFEEYRFQVVNAELLPYCMRDFLPMSDEGLPQRQGQACLQAGSRLPKGGEWETTAVPVQGFSGSSSLPSGPMIFFGFLLFLPAGSSALWEYFSLGPV